MNNLEKKETWKEQHPSGLLIEIFHWGVERGKFDSMNDGHGVWNYYILLPEQLLKDKFESLWLEDKRVRFTPDSPERITHDYMSGEWNVDEWHGGITFYDKIGQLVGHRAVKLGCDYSHLWDMERGYGYTLEEVYRDAVATADSLALLYNLPKNKS